MQKLDKIKPVKVQDQQVEIDPRSKTTADGAFNLIGTGKPEMPCLLYTSPSPRDGLLSRMPSSA